MYDYFKRYQYQYWIDLLGKIHRYKGKKTIKVMKELVSIHYEISHSLFPDVENPCSYLEKLGWVKVCEETDVDCYKEPTQAQINTLDKNNLLHRLFIFDTQVNRLVLWLDYKNKA